MPFDFKTTDNTRQLRRVWKGKYPLPDGQTQNTYTPVEQKPGGSFIGAIYEKKPTKPGKSADARKKRWLGKPGFSQRGFENPTVSVQIQSLLRRGLDAIAEKIAGDAYHVANRGLYIVPKHRLGKAPIIHEFLESGNRLLAEAYLTEINKSRQEKIRETIHIFSKWIDGYQDFATVKARDQGATIDFMDCLIKHHHVPEQVWIDDQEIPLVGLMDILAVSRLVGDTDVLGGGGSNAGIVVQRNPQGQAIVAIAVKIDPGYAFNFKGMDNKFHQTRMAQLDEEELTEKMLQDLKDIQIGNNQDAVIAWAKLTEAQQLDFLVALHHGHTVFQEGKMIEILLLRQGDFEYQGEALMKESTAKTIAADWRKNLNLQKKTYAVGLEARLEERRAIQEKLHRSWQVALEKPHEPPRVSVREEAGIRQASTPNTLVVTARSDQVASSGASAVQSSALAAPAFFAAAAAKPAIKQADVERLLLHVARGEQDKAEAMLKIKGNEALLLHKGKVTDYSNRTFKKITAFQYALWALDWHMWKMITKYLPKDKAAEQLQELESQGTKHGQHYDFTPLIKALKTYVDNCPHWTAEQCKNHWIKVVGRAQTKVPAHVANEYCRPDRSFSPTPSFKEDSLPRSFDIYEDNKFFPLAQYSWGSLSSDFGVYRSWRPGNMHRARWCVRVGWCRDAGIPGRDDGYAISGLCEIRTGQYQELKRELTTTLAARPR